VDYLDKALGKVKKRQKVIYWEPSTCDALDRFCVDDRSWNASTFSEAAVLEKLERERQARAIQKPDLIMRRKE
jgi:hypothetical protein